MLKERNFHVLNNMINKLHGFDPENNYYDDHLYYGQIDGFFLKNFFHVTKKIFENIVLFLNYNDFVANYNNKENYLIEYYDKKQLEEYHSMNYDDFILNPKVVLLSNHGYNKDLNLLFVFDVLVSPETEIWYNDDRQKYFFYSFEPTFIFYGLLLNKKLELLSIIYKYSVDRTLELSRHDYVLLLERNNYINEILETIDLDDKVSSVIKQYFSIYKKIISNIIDNKDVYTIEDKYELDNFIYGNKLASEKHLLYYYHDLGCYYNGYGNVNPYSYLRYYMIILSSRVITNFITPKELSHSIKVLKLGKTTRPFETINLCGSVMSFVDRNDSIILIRSNKNYLKNIKSSKKLNTREFSATVLKKQTENLPLFFPNIEYEVKSFYKDFYNWKYIFYFNSLGKHDFELNTINYNQFQIIIFKEVNVHMFDHSFSALFIRYVIKLNANLVNRKININVSQENIQAIIFSSNHLKVMPYYYVNFLIDDEDIEQINDFISQNMCKYYKDYNEYDCTLPLYVYGEKFKLKVILLNHFFDFDTYKNSFATMEFYKDGVSYVAILISQHNIRRLDKDTVIDNQHRVIKFLTIDEHNNNVEIILSMKNDDYISKGIHRYYIFGTQYSTRGLFNLFISIAIPKHKFQKIMEEIQNSPEITIEGDFLMNLVDKHLYLNGFL